MTLSCLTAFERNRTMILTTLLTIRRIPTSLRIPTILKWRRDFQNHGRWTRAPRKSFPARQTR
jgi:hypothetical protein